jgi:2-(1,2-epoxy-1,2-dihydrophenyl)acetyl-CoA isomerase
MSEAVLVETKGAVRILTLNRPERLNALNADIQNGLSRAFDEIEADETVRAVLLTGAGRGFCAGADLNQNAGVTRDLGESLDKQYNPLVRRMRALPKPIVSAINGVAAGAGVNIALAGDVIIAATSANFTQAFIRIGLVPDAGGTFFLPRLIGDARARGLAMLGETITAAQALEFGLVFRVFETSLQRRRHQHAGRAAGFGTRPATQNGHNAGFRRRCCGFHRKTPGPVYGAGVTALRFQIAVSNNPSFPLSWE